MYSIIVPYYKPYHDYFLTCLQSIINQTYKVFECFIVVDKSDEPHFDILDSRVNVIYSECSDQSTKRNCGLVNAKGDYVIFVDCDDIVDSNFLKKTDELLAKSDIELIAFNYTRELINIGKINNQQGGTVLPRDLFMKSVFACFNNDPGNYVNAWFDSACAKVFKKSIIDKHDLRFVEGLKCAEDSVFVRNYCLYASNAYIDNSYNSYYWRINNNSTMNDIHSGFYDIENYLVNLINIFEKIDKQYYSGFDDYVVNVLMSRIKSITKYRKEHHVSRLAICSFVKKQYRCSTTIKNSLRVTRRKEKRFRLIRYALIHNIYLLLFPIL